MTARDAPRGVRLAVGLWAALLVAVTVRVAVQRPGQASVVPIYLAAAEFWRAGTDLYAPNNWDVYRYPPGFAAAFAPLAHLPEKLVEVGWRLLGAAVLLKGVVRFGRRTGLSPAAVGWMAVVAAVLSIPAVNNGQVNTLIAGAALNGTADAMRGRWWRAAAWFALGAWVKVYPLAAGLLAAVARPRLAGPLLAVTAAGFLLPLLAGPDYVAGQYRGFVRSQLNDDRTDASPDRVPRDWTVLPRTHLGVVVPNAASKAVSLAAAAGLAGLVVWRRSLPLAVVLGCGWMTAFGPATEGNTYAILAGAAGWACVAAGPAWARRLAWAGTALLAAAVLRGAAGAGVSEFELLGVQPAGAVLVMAAAVGLTRPGTMGA